MVDIKDKHQAKDLYSFWNFPSYSNTVNQLQFAMTLFHNLAMMHSLT